MTAPRQPYLRLGIDADGAEVWLEPCEGDEHLGLCVGAGDTSAEALADAGRALADAQAQLDAIMRAQ